MNIAGRKVSFEKGAWDRCRTTEEIDEFNETWISVVVRKMKDYATKCVSRNVSQNLFCIAYFSEPQVQIYKLWRNGHLVG